MEKKHFKFFKFARDMSKQSSHPRVYIGAVVVHKNTVIGGGTNLHKSHPMQMQYNKFNPKMKENCNHFIHAEISAIIHTGTTELDGCSIYVYREDKKGNLAMCRPCPSCMALIKVTGIKKIYYTTKDGFCEEIIS